MGVLIPPIDLAEQQLAILKAQLQQVLARVEDEERVIEARLEPRSVEDIEFLQKKLTSALEELGVKKEQLKKEQLKKKGDEKQ
jgi:hypothetical protein